MTFRKDPSNDFNNAAEHWAETRNQLTLDEWLDEVQTWEDEHIDLYSAMLDVVARHDFTQRVFITTRILDNMGDAFVESPDFYTRIAGAGLLGEQGLNNMRLALEERRNQFAFENGYESVEARETYTSQRASELARIIFPDENRFFFFINTLMTKYPDLGENLFERYEQELGRPMQSNDYPIFLQRLVAGFRTEEELKLWMSGFLMKAKKKEIEGLVSAMKKRKK